MLSVPAAGGTTTVYRPIWGDAAEPVLTVARLPLIVAVQLPSLSEPLRVSTSGEGPICSCRLSEAKLPQRTLMFAVPSESSAPAKGQLPAPMRSLPLSLALAVVVTVIAPALP